MTSKKIDSFATTIESTFYNTFNDISDKTNFSHIFSWFYISRAVIFVGYNDIGYMLF